VKWPGTVVDYSVLPQETVSSSALTSSNINRAENMPDHWKAAGSRTGVLANDYNQWDIGATDPAGNAGNCADCTTTYSLQTRMNTATLPTVDADAAYSEPGPNYNVFPHPSYELGQRHFVFKPIEKNEGRPALDLKANLNWGEDGVSPYCEEKDDIGYN
jgi:hypothetical protein